MPRSRETAFCCGGGGAKAFMEESIGTRIAVERSREAIGTGARVIATACPFCTTMLALLLIAGFDPVSARNKARINESATVADVRVGLTEDQAYAVVEKARDTAVERGVALAQGVVVEGTAVDAVTLVTLETEADLVIVGSKGVDSLFGRIFGAVSVQVLRKSKCDVLVVVP